jgi:hypothetical protein
MKGGVGALPPARGSTPVPRPQPSDYRYKRVGITRAMSGRGFISKSCYKKSCYKKGEPRPPFHTYLLSNRAIVITRGCHPLQPES